MWIVTHAGFFYGPFEAPNDAATFADDAKLVGPWHIVKLRSTEDTIRRNPDAPSRDL